MAGSESCELIEHEIHKIGKSIPGCLVKDLGYVKSSSGLDHRLKTLQSRDISLEFGWNRSKESYPSKLPEILKLEKCSFNYFGILAICVSGDSSSTVSAICYTVPKSAMGSSLYALESALILNLEGCLPRVEWIFGPGVTMSTCDVMIIDDSEYEEEEEFEIAWQVLPTMPASEGWRLPRCSLLVPMMLLLCPWATQLLPSARMQVMESISGLPSLISWSLP